MEEGQPLETDEAKGSDRPTHRRVAPLLANATPQERLATILRSISAQPAPTRTTYNPGAVQDRPNYGGRGGGDGTGPLTARTRPPPPPRFPPPAPSAGLFNVPSTSTAPPPTQPSAAFLYGAPGPHFPQNYTGGNAGVYGFVGPGSFQPQGYAGGGAMGYGYHGRSGPFPGPRHPAQELITQSGVLRGGRLDRHVGPVQQLSSACQARSFNPEFRVTMYDKMYKCDILVQDHLIQGSQRYENPQDAKVHTAAKALKMVQQWPLPDPAAPATSSLADSTNRSTRGRQDERNIKKEGEDEKNGALATAPPGPSHASGVDMADPRQARAFIEGYRMGQQAGARSSSTEAQASDTERVSKRQPLQIRSRSRSSRRDGRGKKRRRYRSRSPGRYYDGSRHNPALPSTDKYRPAPSLARRNVDKPKAEDTYGRLKEEDYNR